MAYTGINKSTDYFNTKLYTGNGTTNTAITGVGFQPDLSIIKARDMNYDHNVMDAVRGSTKRVATNLTDAESTQAEMIKSFASDGFNLGDNGGVNQNTKTYVAWNWKANGSGSANTDGSISSTVSANTTSGFSIVTWNGNSGTVGHGLGVKPNFIVIKSRQTGGSNNWVVAHSALGTNMNDNYIILNSTGAAGSGSNTWGGEPTAQHFTVAGSVAANDNNIAYCFAEKTGYSKFGSYTGNGNADGTFVYTGFKPAFVMYKKAIQTGGNTGRWSMEDNKRDPFNVTTHGLAANSSSVENTGSNYWDIDMLSNGFKMRTTEHETNGSGETFIYMAFAEAPLVGSNNVPCTAR